jgi:hypothetical protein
MLPSVQIKKADFQTGVVKPSSVGIMAIIAASAAGNANVAGSYLRDDLLFDDVGEGPLVQYGSYCLQAGENPVVAVKGAASTAGTIVGPLTKSVAGSASPTFTGTPVDEYAPGFVIVAGGALGTAGITFQYTLDGQTLSGVTALGTATTFAIPAGPNSASGVTINFGSSSATYLPGDNAQTFTTRPLNTDVDLASALEGLRITRLPWEGVLIDCTLGTSTVGLVDTWLQGLEAVGQFHFALLNYRHKIQPAPTGETEAAYATAIIAATQALASIRVCVGADAAALTSTMTGWSQPRPTALFLAARAMLIPIGEDPAYVGRGPLTGASIADGNGNPLWHDEDLYPNLDSQRLVTLRSFAPGGPQGVYITDANVLSPNGSDYVWLQHVRTMNVACGIAYQVLTTLLSIGVGKKPADPITGQVYIQEKDAQRIEGLVNAALAQPMKGQVNQVLFTLSRTDNLSSNSDSTVTGQVQIVGLEYIKKFVVTTSFATSV